MKTTIGIIIGVIALSIIIVSLFGGNPPEQTAPAEAKPAPEFSLTDYAGNSVSLADFRGTPVLINSWAAWCPFCKEELADFAQIKQEFGEKLEIIAIDRAEPQEVAKKYSDELGVSDKFIFLLDPSDSFYHAIGGFSMPETIFVDADGNIQYHKRGPMKAEEIRRRVEQTFGL